VDISKRLRKTSVKRDIIEKQLLTGHMRLDLGHPLSQGNFILFKGEKNTGNTYSPN